jgi:hypothetical protein
MQHIYENIEGWFTFPELYKNIVANSNDNAHLVEVGTWFGKSASYMAVEILNSGKKIKFDCIDTWDGSEEHKNLDVIKNNDLYNSFLKNIEPVKEIINPIRLPSLEAVKLYEDNSLDFVFIDASHQYEDVKNDINAWYPKVKAGGILAGHDYPTWSEVLRAVTEFTEEYNYELQLKGEEICWSIKKRLND